MHYLDVITEAAKAIVATMAEETAYLAGFVAMVYVELSLFARSLVDWEVIRSADGAAAFLGVVLLLVLVMSYAVQLASAALADNGFANASSPFSRGVCLAPVAMRTAMLATVVWVLFAKDVHWKMVNWFRDSTSCASLLGQRTACLASAHATLSSSRELAGRLPLFTAKALDGVVIDLAEQVGLNRLALHLNSLGSSAGPRLLQAARGQLVESL